MSRVIDLSCDLGEARTDADRITEQSIWPLISAANVACGGHVGDEATMREAIGFCLAHSVILGAHPSYPDRMGFGRRPMSIGDEDLFIALSSQLVSLRDLAAGRGLALERVKPHGTLYNKAHHDAHLASIIVRAVRDVAPRAAIVCAAESRLEEVAVAQGCAVIREAFADRRYRPDGTLVSRNEDNALLVDFGDAVRQALGLADRGEVIASDGSLVMIDFETLCIHSDMEGSVDRLTRIRAELERAGFTLGASQN